MCSRENGNPKKDLRPPFFGSFFDFVELRPLKRSSVGRAKNEQSLFQDKESDKLTGSVIRTTCAWSKPSISVFCNNIINRISDKTGNYNEHVEKRPEAVETF